MKYSIHLKIAYLLLTGVFPFRQLVSYVKNFMMKPSSTRILAVLFPLLLSACGDEGCINAGSFSTVYTKTSVIRADSVGTTSPDGRGTVTSSTAVWIDSGINADGQNQVEINTEGTIATCTTNKTTQNFVQAAQSGTWKAMGLTIAPGDELKIVLQPPRSGSCSYESPKDCTSYASCSNIWDNNSGTYCQNNGVGLLGYIGSAAPSPNQGPDNGAGVVQLIQSMTLAPWGNSNTGDIPNGGFSGVLSNLTTSGDLYLKINDCDTQDGCMHDNHGGYAANITLTSHNPPPASCTYTNGSILDAVIKSGDSAPTSRTDGYLLNVTGGYSGIPTHSGKIWLKVYDSSNVYSDNTGSYYVTVTKTVLQNHNTSTLVNSVTKPIQDMINTVTQAVYHSIIDDSHFKRIVKGCLLLYIIFYAIFFMLGFIKDKQIDLVVRTVKVGIMVELISEDSWNFFDQYLFSLFRDGSTFLISAMTGGSGDGGNTFAFLDTTISQFFSNSTWIKLGTLLFAGPLGFVYFAVIILGMGIFIIAIVEAVIAYLISMVAISVMIILAPFFLIALLFSATRGLFDAWISHIFNFALQPALLFAGLVIFNELMVITFYQAMAYKVCSSCVFAPVIPLISLGMPASIPLIGGANATIDIPLGCWMSYYLPAGMGASEVWNPASFFVAIMMYLIMSDATRKFVECSPDIVAMLTSAGGGGDRLQLSTGGTMDAMKGLVAGAINTATGRDAKSVERRRNQTELTEAMNRLRGQGNQPLGGSDDVDDSDIPQSTNAASHFIETLAAGNSALQNDRKAHADEGETLTRRAIELAAAEQALAKYDADTPFPSPQERENIAAAKEKLEKEKELLAKDKEQWESKGAELDAREAALREEAIYAREAAASKHQEELEKKNLDSLRAEEARLKESQASLDKQEEKVDVMRQDLERLSIVEGGKDSEDYKKKEKELGQEEGKLQTMQERHEVREGEFNVHKEKYDLDAKERAMTTDRAALDKEAKTLRAMEESVNARGESFSLREEQGVGLEKEGQRLKAEQEQLAKERHDLTAQQQNPFNSEKETEALTQQSAALAQREEANMQAIEKNQADSAAHAAATNKESESLIREQAAFVERKDAFNAKNATLSAAEASLPIERERNELDSKSVELHKEENRLHTMEASLGREGETLSNAKRDIDETREGLKTLAGDIVKDETYVAEKGPELEARSKEMEAKIDRGETPSLEEFSSLAKDKESFGEIQSSLKEKKAAHENQETVLAAKEVDYGIRDEAFKEKTSFFEADKAAHAEKAKSFFEQVDRFNSRNAPPVE